ncbi:MAG: sialate O-acetylesterase [Planctomycetota bacterium]|nr:MAG: sialate O-acetylesterase [Planctomycetota bacterium]REK37507.1 MAG: sialate O-acetylesterase [Planctomycetota bacterium]
MTTSTTQRKERQRMTTASRIGRGLVLGGLLALLLGGLVPAASADVRLPSIFTDNLVLQREQAVPVWGWAEPGEAITVTFADQNVKTTAGDDGRWRVDLEAMPASDQSRVLTVNGNNTLTISNVLVGEVWVCSGQSNMEWTVRISGKPEEERRAANYPLIRHIKVPRRPADVPQENFGAAWTVCSPDTVSNYTAVGYYFARRLHLDLNVPIGLINTSWGGTRIEPWITVGGFRSIGHAAFAPDIVRRIETADPSTQLGKQAYGRLIAEMRRWTEDAQTAVAAGRYPPPYPARPNLGSSNQDPARLYRGMVHPLVPYAIRGAIWYQGESNGTEDATYYEKKHALVQGWREAWGQGDFPFYWVQLANFTKDTKEPAGDDGYARTRDAQRRALDLPNSGMAVIIDIGEADDIHPKNKQDVGHRLAQWALARDYGRAIVPSGPLYRSHEIDGDSIRIHFDHVGEGLMVGKKSGYEPTVEVPQGQLARFAIAGAERRWVWADAKIDGDTVVVSSPQVDRPLAVRYAHSANPEGANLYNRAGLPASPFRTDRW